MRLQKRKGTVDGYEWRCRNQSKDNRHDVVRSVRKGTWFSESKLAITIILRLTRYWYNRSNQKPICYPDNIPSALRLVPHGPNVSVPLLPNELQKISRGMGTGFLILDDGQAIRTTPELVTPLVSPPCLREDFELRQI
ncbi:hypothetical protein TNCV_2113381 [Trichonephila clavipes]|nr:hypothetical protein TNCV_2113381 [Trichonephila clavipes]